MAPQPPPPRKPPIVSKPGGVVGRPNLGQKSSVPTPTTRNSGRSTELARPPLIPVLLSAGIVLFVTWAMFAVSRDSVELHVLAAAIGMFGSVGILGWFRQSLNVKRSTGAFSEWPGPWESTRYMWLLVTLAWLGGAMNLYFAVYELVRPK